MILHNAKPCPFCGNPVICYDVVESYWSREAIREHPRRTGVNRDGLKVMCYKGSKSIKGCGASGPLVQTEEEGLLHWNNRKE